MSWEKLKSALQQMPDIGELGFEGLAKHWLERILGEKFLLARSGTQLSGDAHSIQRNVCLQAKRYSETTPNAKNIEGDFDAALRALPLTDMYVLAITRDAAQLDDTIDAMRVKSGVDILVWDFENEESALATLCCQYWDDLSQFPSLESTAVSLHVWAERQCKSSSHDDRYKEIVDAVREYTKTFTDVSKAAQGYLNRRFGLNKTAQTLPFHVIDLARAIDRNDYREKIFGWWHANKQRVIVLSGAEGMGKTWVAAQGVEAIRKQQTTLTFWLDSVSWRSCQSIRDVLTDAVTRLQLGDSDKVARLVRKIQTRWSQTTLIVLDGVNERGALEAAQKILHDLIEKDASKCRLIFTTRPLVGALELEKSLWDRWQPIAIGEFTDSEFVVAVASATPPLSVNDIPKEVQRVARIPRYFQTCLKLKDQLKGLANISVAIVLWQDLLEKINGMEPGMRHVLKWSDEDDAIAVLIKLAAELPTKQSGGDRYALLDQCFGGNYAETRNYLKELRILDKATPLDATLSRYHTILGRALFLREMLRGLPQTHATELADRLQLELEPLAGEDGQAESFFVALQLSALSGRETALQRAALLYGWVFSHNSEATDDRLLFWARADIHAYAIFIEAFFEALYRGETQDFVVKPLAIMWSAGETITTGLIPYLQKWLLIIWRPLTTTSLPSVFEHEGHSLPFARTSDQVRLASVALSLLSLRPTSNILRELSICYVTTRLSVHQVRDQSGKQHEFPLKNVCEQIGILMRWGYTEKILPELQQIASENANDTVLISGLTGLARELRLVTLPPPFNVHEPCSHRTLLGRSAMHLLAAGKPLFSRTPNDEYLSERDFGYLAVRDDVRDMRSEDQQVLINLTERIVEELCTGEAKNGWGMRDLEHWWPWYAKFKPREFAYLVGRLSLAAMRQKNSMSLLMFVEGILPAFTEQGLQQWLELADSKCEVVVSGNRLADYTGLQLSETALLMLDNKPLVDWFQKSSTTEGRRYTMCFGPLMELIPLVIPRTVYETAKTKCLAVSCDAIGAGLGAPSEPEYWCYLSSLGAEPDAELHEWALNCLQAQSTLKHRNFSLLRLWLRTAQPGQLESELPTKAVATLFNLEALRAWALSGPLGFNPGLVRGTYEELMRLLPQDFVGGIFAKSNRLTELSRWGKELMLLAGGQIDRSPVRRSSQRTTQLVLTAAQQLQSITYERERAETHATAANASTWGVNYDSLAVALTQSDFKEQETEFARWKLDEEEMENWEHYDLYAFAGWSALEAWSEHHQEEFLEYGLKLLKSAATRESPQHHIGGLLHAVVCCLLPYKPDEAWKYYTLLSDTLRLSVSTHYNVPEFYDVLWREDRCGSEFHEKLRKQILEECDNEFEIMVCAVSALANGATNQFTNLAEGFLRCAIAKERALGVSMLAWIGNTVTSERLRQLSQDDPSSWIREHATWALQVSLRENATRAFYRKSLRITDPVLFSAALEVLKPALTPLARWWRHEVANAELKSGTVLTAQCEAILVSFWHHIECRSSSSVEVGRDLNGYCRGERLDSTRTSRLFPWWSLG